MKPQAFQFGELRDANDTIIRDGTYGKKTPLATKDNVGVIDYIQTVYGSPNYYSCSTCEQSMFSIFDVTNYL